MHFNIFSTYSDKESFFNLLFAVVLLFRLGVVTEVLFKPFFNQEGKNNYLINK